MLRLAISLSPYLSLMNLQLFDEKGGTASTAKMERAPFPCFWRGGFKGSQAEQETQPRSPCPELWVRSRSSGPAPAVAVHAQRSLTRLKP